MNNIAESNKKLVDTFFVALETQQFDLLKDIFATGGKQLNPYARKAFRKVLMGLKVSINNTVD